MSWKKDWFEMDSAIAIRGREKKKQKKMLSTTYEQAHKSDVHCMEYVT
jgi:hypothetical protein